MPPSPEPASRSSLSQVLRTIAARWWVFALCLIIGAGALYGISSRKEKQYEATATLLFGAPSVNLTGVLNAGASNTSSDPQRDQGTTLTLVTSRAVAARVQRRLRLLDSPSDLTDQVTASAVADANLIDITALDPDPNRAAALANAFAEEYKAFRRRDDRQGLAQGIQELEQQRSATPTNLTAQRANISQALNQLRILQAASTGGVSVASAAAPPTTAALPRPKRDALLGAILGLAIGAIIVFGLDLVDRKLKSIAALEEAYGMPALAVVPFQRSPPRTARQQIQVLEPYRILRSSLSSLSKDPLQVVMVTSAAPGEGKSTTAAGLARAVALSGQRVVLVELDLRRPTFHQTYDLGSGRPGLTAALQDGVPVTELLSPGPAGYPTLELLPAGGVPSRSAELVGGARMDAVLAELAAYADFVVLDAAPLLPVADTRAALDLQELDACLIVSRSHETRRDDVARALAILAQHRVARVGLVVNGVRGADVRDSYDYGTMEETQEA